MGSSPGQKCPDKDAHLTGWPSPSAQGSAGETSEDLERRGEKWVNGKTGRVLQTNLATDAKMLAGWPTAASRDYKDGTSTAGMNRPGRGATNSLLPLAANLASWPTPTATERENDTTATPSEASLERYEKGEIARIRKTRAATLTTEVLGTWPTPRTVTGGPESATRKQELGRTESGGGDLQAAALASGVMSNGSPAGTARRGQLNPALPRWLMGFPRVWCVAAIAAHRKLKASKRAKPA